MPQDKLAEIYVEINARTEKLDKEISKLRRKLDKDAQKIGRVFSNTFSKVLTLGGGLLAFRKLLDFSIIAKNAARDAAEIQSKFNTVFKNLKEEANVWAETFALSVGRAKQDVKAWLAELQDTFVPLGFAREKAKELSESLVQLAVDVASFNNKADADVIRDFTSAIVGNHETVRKYGILISEAALKQEALNLGYKKSYNSLTELEKVRLRYNIILNSTKDAQGDAIRTADSLANKEKRLEARLKDLSETLGKQLIPVFLEATNKAIEFIRTFTESAIDTAIRRIKELGGEANRLKGTLDLLEKLNRKKQLIELNDIIQGKSNSILSRVKRIKQWGLEWEQIDRVNRELVLMRDNNVSLERKEAKRDAVVNRLMDLYEQLAKRKSLGEDTDGIGKLINFYEYELEIFNEIINAYKKIKELQNKTSENPQPVRETQSKSKQKVLRYSFPRRIKEFSITNENYNLPSSLVKVIPDYSTQVNRAFEIALEWIDKSESEQQLLFDKMISNASKLGYALEDAFSGHGQTLLSYMNQALQIALNITNAFKKNTGSFSDVLGIIASIVPGFGLLTKIAGGGRAIGGAVYTDKVYTVGERGPELFIPSMPGVILSNHSIKKGFSGNDVTKIVKSIQAMNLNVEEKLNTLVNVSVNKALQAQLHGTDIVIAEKRTSKILGRYQ